MFRSTQKNILKPTLIIAGILIAGGAVTSAVSAVTFSQDVGVSFTFNPSIAVTLSSNDLIISNLTPGTASDSNIINVNVKTNNITGYTINATVGNNTTFNTRDLINKNSDVTDKFSSVAFGTIVASNTALTNDTWGYSYSLDNGTNWIANTASSTSAGYSGLPLYSDADNVAKLKETTGPAATAAGDDIKFKIAAKASNEIASGEYNNVINFTAVANPEPQLEPISCSGANKICYSPNSLGTVDGSMGEQSTDDNGNNLTGGSTVTLLASNFSQTGYGFAGWSDVPDYATNANAHFYGPQETITTPADMSAGLPLYAVWVESAGSMQANAASVCSGLTTALTNGTANLDSVSALTDQRDNQTYAIAKLADGNCWMIENLRLENTGTDNTNGSLAQGYGGQFAGLADPETADKFISTYSANSLYSNDGADNTTNIGTSNTAYRMPRYNNINTPTNAADRPQNPTTNGATNSTSNASMYSYGNYYSWHAAIADTTAYTSNNTSVTNASICPTGWHLPKAGNKTRIESNDDNDFWNFTVDVLNGGTNPANYDSQTRPYYTGTAEAGPVADKLRSYPNNFVYSGYVVSGSVDGRGSYGGYWSSTASSSNYAYYLSLSSSRVYPGTNYYDKYYGRPVRCVAPGV